MVTEADTIQAGFVAKRITYSGFFLHLKVHLSLLGEENKKKYSMQFYLYFGHATSAGAAKLKLRRRYTYFSLPWVERMVLSMAGEHTTNVNNSGIFENAINLELQ